MNRELVAYFTILIALVVGALYYNNRVQSPILSSLNYIKSSYHTSVEYLSTSVEKYFFQASQISQLQEDLQAYEKNHLVMQQLASELHDLYDESHSPLSTNPQVSLVRTIAYEKFGNLNRLWIEVPEYNASKIYGLTYKESVAGIVVAQDEKPLALLNKDIKSAYAVYVGAKSAPGIAHGKNENYLVVDFIPEWFEIKEGDEVVTSGLDNIFFKGLKVGKVISSTKSQGYQNAIIEPYYKANEPSYHHIIRRVK